MLKDIGIVKKGAMASNGSYVIDLDTYDEYGKMYSILENAEEEGKIEQIPEKSIINIHNTDISYIRTEDEDTSYEISLLGDLDQDIYKIIVMKF